MSLGYGQDTSCTTDLPLRDAQVSGSKVVLNSLYRRLTTPAGALALIGDDPGYGFALQNLINDSLTPASIGAYQTAIRAQVLRDERISDTAVLISFSAGTVSVSISGTLSTNQTFSFVLTIDQVTGEVLTRFE